MCGHFYLACMKTAAEQVDCHVRDSASVCPVQTLHVRIKSSQAIRVSRSHPGASSFCALSDFLSDTSTLRRAQCYQSMSIVRQQRWQWFAAGVGAASAFYVSQKVDILHLLIWPRPLKAPLLSARSWRWSTEPDLPLTL